jgi:hypothetical protein
MYYSSGNVIDKVTFARLEALRRTVFGIDLLSIIIDEEY